MKYIIEVDNGYYKEDVAYKNKSEITSDLDEATIFELDVELTDEILENDLDLNWRLDTCKRVGGINPRFRRVKLELI